MYLYKYLCLSIAMLWQVYSFAQTDKTIVIKAGDDKSALTRQIYLYPDFRHGVVYYFNGDSAAGKLNYNMLDGQMQFMGAKSDTLALANEETIQYIRINNDLFYYSGKKCLAYLDDYDFTRLGIVRRIRLADEQKTGAYGLKTSTGTIENKNSLKADQNLGLILNEDLVLTKEEELYFTDTAGNFHLLTKSNLVQSFPRKKKAIENYFSNKKHGLKDEMEAREFFAWLRPQFQ
jgi:hypothetical protein